MGSSDTLFNVYWIALIASGIIMLAIAGTGVGGLSVSGRAINAIFGVGYFGYGFYLGFLFHGEKYFIFFKAFILPVLLIVNTIRHAIKHRQTTPQSTLPTPATLSYPGQPQPGQQYAAPQQYATPQQYGPPQPYAHQQQYPQQQYPAQPYPQQPHSPAVQANPPAHPAPYQSPIQPG